METLSSVEGMILKVTELRDSTAGNIPVQHILQSTPVLYYAGVIEYDR